MTEIEKAVREVKEEEKWWHQVEEELCAKYLGDGDVLWIVCQKE
jgi:hypothetical protein